MKKVLCIASLFVSGLITAQTYPLVENFDAVSTSGTPAIGTLPSGWTTSGGFQVYGLENLAPHGDSPNNACSVEMSASNTQDTLYTPMIGAITANTKVGVAYRFVNKASYPNSGYQLTSGDKVTIDAYLAGSWQNSIATIDMTVVPSATTSYATYTYNCTACATLIGFGQTTIQLRLDVARANGDWYLDIDDFQVADNLSFVGIEQHKANAPQLSVYPNPSNGNFTVSLKNYQAASKVDVNIYDIIGKKVKSISAESAVNNEINVNTTGLEKGLYFVEVKAGSEAATSKIQID